MVLRVIFAINLLLVTFVAKALTFEDLFKKPAPIKNDFIELSINRSKYDYSTYNYGDYIHA